MEINKLYTNLLISLGLTVNESNGAIMVDETTPLKINGIPAYLPLEEHNNTCFENGSQVKYLFNPLDENRLSGIDPSLKKIIAIHNVMLNISVKYTIVGLLSQINSKDKTAYPLFLNSLMESLSEAKGNAKQLVDDKLLGIVLDMSQDHNLVAIKSRISNGVYVDGEKVHSAMSISSPVIKSLEDEDFIPKSRKKDIRVIVSIYKWILDYLADEENNIVAYSSHDDVPDFIAFYKMVVHLSDKMGKLQDYIKNTGYSSDMLDNDLDTNDLRNMDTFIIESHLIPDVTKGGMITKSNVVEMTDNVNDGSVTVISSPEQLGLKTNNNQPVYQPPIQPPMYQPPMYQPIQPQIQPPMYQPQIQPPMYQPPMYDSMNRPIQNIPEEMSLYDKLQIAKMSRRYM